MCSCRDRHARCFHSLLISSITEFRCIARAGVYVRTIGSKGAGAGEFEWPSGLCLSLHGELLLVADINNHRVHVLRVADGMHMRSIGILGSGNGQFKFPQRVCVAVAGEWLFVTDSGNHRE